MHGPSLAIVDDDIEYTSMTAGVAKRRGLSTTRMHSFAEAGAWLGGYDPDLVLVGVALADSSGFDVPQHITPAHQGRVVLVSGGSSLETACRAVATAATVATRPPQRVVLS